MCWPLILNAGAKYTDNFRAKIRESCVMLPVGAKSTPPGEGVRVMRPSGLLMLPSAGRRSRTAGKDESRPLINEES